jgi:hypothetical protein
MNKNQSQCRPDRTGTARGWRAGLSGEGLLPSLPRRRADSDERGQLCGKSSCISVHKCVYLGGGVWISLWTDAFFDTQMCDECAENAGLWIKKAAYFVKTMKVK